MPLTRLAAGILSAALLGSGCGTDGDPTAEARVDQVRAAAEEAGLSSQVADVLALAARGATARFQVTYPGSDGAEIVVSQDPPNHRVDVLSAGLIVESQVERDGVGYLCRLPETGRPGDDLECARGQGALSAAGSFTQEALDRFAADLAAVRDEVVLTVEERVVAKVEATCLISAPRPGTVLDGSDTSVDTICLAPDGTQLLVDVGGDRVVASSYSTTVPAGTFDV